MRSEFLVNAGRVVEVVERSWNGRGTVVEGSWKGRGRVVEGSWEGFWP